MMAEGASDPTSRLTAALEGRYEIQHELGAGGMATVYLARDVRHDRDVAIKVLKPELAAVIGGERFITEIRTTANLQHPHILPLFDSGESDGFLYYVMPFVEGESLRDKLDRDRQLAVEESLEVARAVASALDYAHRQGVVHRDIKPENILLHDGNPVVADFGIALALSAAGGGRLTETGLSLGTPHYMSPEQATADRDLSARSDVYSLACVLYEMLAGDPPHTGPTAQAILMRILTEDPRPVTDVRRSVPPHVDAVLAKALEKLPADRFDSAEAFRSALTDEGFSYAAPARSTVHAATGAGAMRGRPIGGTGGGGGSSADPWTSDRRLLGVSAVAAVALALAIWGWMDGPADTLGDPPFRSLLQTEEFLPAGAQFVAVSADGSRIALNGRDLGESEGTSMGIGSIWVRSTDEEGFRRVPNTENAFGFSLSPDGEWLVFTSQQDSALVKISASGESAAPFRLVGGNGIQPVMPHWTDDDQIVFTTGEALYRVEETGQDLELLADSIGDILGLSSLVMAPHGLPGGRGLLFSTLNLGDEGVITMASGQTVPASISVLDLSDGSVREIIAEGQSPKYLESGHIVYGHPAGGLFAIRFDLERLEVEGSPIHLRAGVRVDPFGAHYDVASNGMLVYGEGGRSGMVIGGSQAQIVLAEEGGVLDTVRLSPRNFRSLRMRPDGRRFAVAVATGPSGGDLHTFDLLDGTPQQHTFEGLNSDPVWSPDGTRIAFSSLRTGTTVMDLFVKEVEGDAPAVHVLERVGMQTPVAWPNDSTLVFEDQPDSPTNIDLYMVDPRGGSEPVRFLGAEYRETALDVSPDGTLAAYVSNEAGPSQVYIRRFPSAEGQWEVSQEVGVEPRWSVDGTTLYYWRTSGSSAGDTLFAARLETDPVPRVLSTDVVLVGEYSTNWDVHPDGVRLLVSEPVAPEVPTEPDAPPEDERFYVVTNWFTELWEILGGGG